MKSINCLKLCVDLLQLQKVTFRAIRKDANISYIINTEFLYFFIMPSMEEEGAYCFPNADQSVGPSIRPSVNQIVSDPNL